LSIGAHVGAVIEVTGGSDAPAPARVTQSIPPAVRRRILERDGRKCSVPGCRHSQYLDLHHVTPRAEGGDHDPDKLVTLCGVHHRAAHVGAIAVTGSYSSGFVFWHADGKRYGAGVSPEVSELRQKVFLGLKGLGFRESDARRAIETALVGPRSARPARAWRQRQQLLGAPRGDPSWRARRNSPGITSGLHHVTGAPSARRSARFPDRLS
jgi:hypothetical protein